MSGSTKFLDKFTKRMDILIRSVEDGLRSQGVQYNDQVAGVSAEVFAKLSSEKPSLRFLHGNLFSLLQQHPKYRREASRRGLFVFWFEPETIVPSDSSVSSSCFRPTSEGSEGMQRILGIPEWAVTNIVSVAGEEGYVKLTGALAALLYPNNRELLVKSLASMMAGSGLGIKVESSLARAMNRKVLGGWGERKLAKLYWEESTQQHTMQSPKIYLTNAEEGGQKWALPGFRTNEALFWWLHIPHLYLTHAGYEKGCIASHPGSSVGVEAKEVLEAIWTANYDLDEVFTPKNQIPGRQEGLTEFAQYVSQDTGVANTKEGTTNRQLALLQAFKRFHEERDVRLKAENELKVVVYQIPQDGVH